MDVILENVKLQFAFVYLDDIVNFARTLQIHIDLEKQTMTLQERAGVTFKLKNAFLSQAGSIFLHT